MPAKSDGQIAALISGPRLRLCLDFANTLAGRGSVRIESLHNHSDVVAWCLSAGFLRQREAVRLLSWSLGNPAEAVSAFADAIVLREAIYGIFAHLASGRDAEEENLNRLNRALTEAPPRSAVARTDAGFGWRIERDETMAAGLLAPVVWSAGDLLTGKHLGRVRLCANHQCLWLFFDDSLRGARRWCSMQACGNRAKTQRHYSRRKAQ
ncbi:MAG: ABATE domain-containing protein [Candidatus Acidiferrales bacterium]